MARPKTMAISTPVSFRTEKQLKQAFYTTCQEMGFNASTLFSAFMSVVVREKCVPFKIKTTRTKGQEQLNNLGRKFVGYAGTVSLPDEWQEKSIKEILQEREDI